MKKFVLALALSCLTASILAQGATDPAQQAFDRALAAMQSGQAAEALAILDPFYTRASTGPLAALYGTALLEAGQAGEALVVLERLADDGTDPAVLYHAARAALLAGEVGKGLDFLERSAALEPVSPAGRELGLLRARQGRNVEAFELLGAWVEARPGDTEALLAVAQAALRLGRTAEARAWLGSLPEQAEAVRLLKAELALGENASSVALEQLAPILAEPKSPFLADAIGMAATAHLAKNDPAAAAKLLSGKTGDDPRLSLLLARALRLSGKLGEAAAVLKPLAEEVLKTDTTNRLSAFASAILFDYGRTLMASSRSREAATVLERAARLNPASLDAWRALAEAATSAGDAEKAKGARLQVDRLAEAERQALQAVDAAGGGGANLKPVLDALVAGEQEKALELAQAEGRRVPDDPRPRFVAVRLLVASNRMSEAQQETEALVAQFPGNADAIYQRGTLRMSSGDSRGAEQDLRQALALRPQHTAAMNDLAVLLMTQKNFTEARALLEKVVAANPNDTLAAQNLKSLPPG